MPRYTCVSQADRLAASAAASPPPPPPSPRKPTRGHMRKIVRRAGGKKMFCQRCVRRFARHPLGGFVCSTKVGHKKCDYCAKQRHACVPVGLVQLLSRFACLYTASRFLLASSAPSMSSLLSLRRPIGTLLLRTT